MLDQWFAVVATERTGGLIRKETISLVISHGCDTFSHLSHII